MNKLNERNTAIVNVIVKSNTILLPAPPKGTYGQQR